MGEHQEGFLEAGNQPIRPLDSNDLGQVRATEGLNESPMGDLEVESDEEESKDEEEEEEEEEQTCTKCGEWNLMSYKCCKRCGDEMRSEEGEEDERKGGKGRT